MNFEWSDDYCSTNPIIDFQHRLLFNFMSKMMVKIKAGQSIEAAEEMVQFFKVYFIEHYGDEEEIMVDTAYPKAYEHTMEHKKIVEESAKLMSLLEKSRYSSAKVHEALILASKWLGKHVNVMDKELIEYLKKYYEEYRLNREKEISKTK